MRGEQCPPKNQEGIYLENRWEEVMEFLVAKDIIVQLDEA
jgi:hypothetical protein